jgi:6-phosphogluconolactonase (cycloisomerase 2 family)
MNADGTLTSVGSPVVVGNSPRSLTVDPSGNFLLVANSGSNNVSVFAINQTNGGLAAVSGSPFATGKKPVSITVTNVLQ